MVRNLQKEIAGCQKCLSLGSNCQKAPLVWMGGDYKGIVLIGESPHKSWLEGNNPFDSPSGKRIVEYLEILGLTINNISLVEVCKCLVEDRKNLEKMMANCISYLPLQIAELSSQLIICFGKPVYRSANQILQGKLKMLELKSIDGVKYLMLYHPSPINPKNHQRNLDYLNQLIKIINMALG